MSSNANTQADAGTSAASTSNQPPAAASGADAAAGGSVLVPTTTIRKARQGLRDVDGGQFTPLKVSIGVYHRGLHSVVNKEPVADRMCPPRGTKWKLVRDELTKQLGRSSNSNMGREWYPDDPSEMKDYFSLSATGRMPLLDDGCYVLHFLVEYYDEETGVVIKDPWRDENENSVMRDILFLLENQIPWSVLREIHRCIRSNDGSSDSDLDEELAHRVPILLEKRLYTISGERRRRPVPSSPAPTHLLDLVHHYLKPTAERPREEAADGALSAPTAALSAAIAAEAAAAPSAPAAASSGEEEEQHRVNIGCCNTGVEGKGGRMGMARWRRATEYRRYAFVQLKRRDFKQGVVESILDVRLEGGTLRIPTLRIDDLTCTILRNLIALEDRMRMSQRPVTAYCLFMSQLACKVEDVELLQRLDILQNFLPTDEDVVKGFGDLCKGVVFEVDDPEMNYLNGTWHQLQKRCRTTGNTFFGLFLEKHCSNSVHTLAFIAAVVLFVLQVAQVVFAALSYFKRR